MLHKQTTAIFVFVLLSGCAGNMEHMTTYGGAADSFASDACGQFCWSKDSSKSGEASCMNEQASAPLQECVAQLKTTGPMFVDKKEAQAQLKACMQTKNWWRITAFIIICD